MNHDYEDITSRIVEPPNTMLSGAWLDELQTRAAEIVDVHEGINPHQILPAQYALSAYGPVAPHVDRDFAETPWSYILILRAPESPILRCHGHADLPLRPGMLVEFNAMRRHSLRQRPTDLLVWMPMDREEQIGLDEAARQHVKDIRHSIETAAKAAGLGHIHPHLFKHTAITWMVERGAPLDDVASWTLTSRQTLERVYAQHAPGRHARVLKALR